LAGSWASPKNLSTHTVSNLNFIDGYAVLSLTEDDALGPAGAMPGVPATGSTGGPGEMETGSRDSAGCSLATTRVPTASPWFGIAVGLVLGARRVKRRSSWRARATR
jgi:hypothetical protein